MDDGAKVALVIGVPLAIAGGVIAASLMTAQAEVPYVPPPEPQPDLILRGTVNYIEIIVQQDGTFEISHYDHRFGVVRSEYFRGFSVDLFKNAWINIYASSWEGRGEINAIQKANSILQAQML